MFSPPIRSLAACVFSYALACVSHAQPVATPDQGAAVTNAGPVAPATKASSRPAWANLTPAQQLALAPLQRDWPSIDADRKAKWLQVANRFASMPADERARVQQRMAEWSQLSPAQRGEARLQFQQSRQIAPTERQAKWDAYQALPEDQRRQLAERAKPIGPAQATPTTASTGGAKRNIVEPAPVGTPKTVTPTVVQSKNGATTTLLSQPHTTPAHQQSGLPKIAATEGFVQPNTLLPKRGPQGAAVRAAAASAPPTAQ